jgi:hypothetical protein
MKRLFTAIATVTLLLAGSLIWKAEAATMTGVGSLAPLTKSHTPIENVYYYRRGYYGYRRHYYGYGYRRPYYGYGYRRPYYGYGYYGYRRPYYRRWRY